MVTGEFQDSRGAEFDGSVDEDGELILKRRAGVPGR